MDKKVNLRKGIAITFVAKYSNIIVQLLINSVLARLLGPEEFGVVAIITVFTSFFTILGDMGLGPAIIQNKFLDENDISDIFKFSMIVSIITAFLFYLFSHFIAFFYSNEIYVRLGMLLSFSVMFSVLKIVPNALIYKSKNFKLAGIIQITTNLIIGCITILLAIKGWSYYALVLDSILKNCLIFILCLVFSGMKLRKGFKINTIQKIGRYSIYQFSFNFMNYFTRNLDNILTGKFLGSSTLAYYDKAYKLMLYPIQNLTHVITPVLHPILSEYQDQKDVIYDAYIKVVKVLAYIGIFISVFCFFSSTEIIRIMYGSNWDKTIPIFRVLSVSIVIQMVLSSIGAIFQATGYVDKLFQTGVVSSVFTIVAILIGVSSGSILVLSISVIISFAFNFIQCFYVLITQIFNKSYLDFLFGFKNVIIIGIIMIVGYIISGNIYIDNVLISCIFKFTVGIVFYMIGLIITKEYILIKDILFKK